MRLLQSCRSLAVAWSEHAASKKQPKKTFSWHALVQTFGSKAGLRLLLLQSEQHPSHAFELRSHVHQHHVL